MISVIIPVGPQEGDLTLLLAQLSAEDKIHDIIVACPSACDAERPKKSSDKIRYLFQGHSRASQMNAAAHLATGPFLWFLHADSQLHPETIPTLIQTLREDSETFYYFQLHFTETAHPLMTLNAWGANLRSQFLGVPFGDQGFCLKKTSFHRIGTYPEEVSYGEDHLLVWRARQNGMTLEMLPATLSTSARKYQKKGWWQTTLLHQYLWLKQAWPEWKKWRACR